MEEVAGVGARLQRTGEPAVAEWGPKHVIQQLGAHTSSVQNVLPNCTNRRMSEMKKGSFSEQSFLGRPSWFMLLLEAKLVSLVYATIKGHAGVCGPSCTHRLC